MKRILFTFLLIVCFSVNASAQVTEFFAGLKAAIESEKMTGALFHPMGAKVELR